MAAYGCYILGRKGFTFRFQHIWGGLPPTSPQAMLICCFCVLQGWGFFHVWKSWEKTRSYIFVSIECFFSIVIPLSITAFAQAPAPQADRRLSGDFILVAHLCHLKTLGRTMKLHTTRNLTTPPTGFHKPQGPCRLGKLLKSWQWLIMDDSGTVVIEKLRPILMTWWWGTQNKTNTSL